MKLAVKICKFSVILLGAFIILMSFDSFDGTDSFWGVLLEFLINSLPGIFIIVLILILWKKELILGVILLVLAICLFFLFKFYRNDFENWLTMIIVEVPLLTAGILFTTYHLKHQRFIKKWEWWFLKIIVIKFLQDGKKSNECYYQSSEMSYNYIIEVIS